MSEMVVEDFQYLLDRVARPRELSPDHLIKLCEAFKIERRPREDIRSLTDLLHTLESRLLLHPSESSKTNLHSFKILDQHLQLGSEFHSRWQVLQTNFEAERISEQEEDAAPFYEQNPFELSEEFIRELYSGLKRSNIRVGPFLREIGHDLGLEKRKQIEIKESDLEAINTPSGEQFLANGLAIIAQNWNRSDLKYESEHTLKASIIHLLASNTFHEPLNRLKKTLTDLP
ncbi:hypothetical protein TCAL_15593 [Tigriopus californicus]|uniref:Uncharacterized protein n=1 Tax=Tigriopus californicus TaxID=6832 RepID=A0A553PBG9_TIGCA|nr:uncharacterized protein LOC131876926 [Tigriopus californicus]TRY75027.1 hypothetical protein TCAL_15593 [Tigriopus californicus]